MGAEGDRWRWVVESLPDPVVVLGTEGLVLLATSAAEEAGLLQGTSLLAAVHPGDRARAASFVGALARGPSTGTVEWRLPAPGGLWRHMEVAWADARTSLGGFVLAMRDVTRRKELEGALAHHSMYDLLTGLATPVLFGERVRHQLQRHRPPSRTVAVLVIDLAEVRELDAEEGPEAGDVLLVELSERLADSVRPADTVAKLKRDEVAALLVDLREEEVDAVVSRILDRLAGSVEVASREMGVLATVGVSLAAPGHDAERLVAEARAALAAAKTTEGCFVQRFRPGMALPREDPRQHRPPAQAQNGASGLLPGGTLG